MDFLWYKRTIFRAPLNGYFLWNNGEYQEKNYCTATYTFKFITLALRNYWKSVIKDFCRPVLACLRPATLLKNFLHKYLLKISHQKCRPSIFLSSSFEKNYLLCAMLGAFTKRCSHVFLYAHSLHCLPIFIIIYFKFAEDNDSCFINFNY